MDLTPRWRKTGKPIKPVTFALMMLLPFLLTTAFMAWVFSETAAGGTQKKNVDPSNGVTPTAQNR